MRIAMLGPISTASIVPHLCEPPPLDFPTGVHGAPFMGTLISSLLERGHEVCAITNGGWATRHNKPVSLRAKRFEFHCAPVRRHSVRPRDGHIGRILDCYAYERRAFGELLATAKPDIVHAHWTYEFGMAAIDSGLPYLVTAHDDPLAVLKMFKDGSRLVRYFMARRVLSKATALSAVSEYLRSRLQRFANVPIAVIPNPLDRRFVNASHHRLLPSAHATHRFISVINGWVHMKNARNGLLAFATLRKSRQDVTYHLFGVDFQYGGPAQRWAEANGVADGVVFHGQVPHAQLIDELKASSVMLHPSRIESCPMGIAEAMALGVPVVGGSDSGGVAWMIDRGGLTVDINQPEKIAEAAMNLISDDRLYQQCSEAAISRVKQFAPETVVAQYEAIYRRVLDDKGGLSYSKLATQGHGV
jgi:glycosyltransferase involved in cell wall biosynthesis